LVSSTVSNIKNDLLGLASVIENQVLPKINKMASGLQSARLLGPNGQPISSGNKVADSGAKGPTSPAVDQTTTGNNKVSSNGTEAAKGGGGGGNTFAQTAAAFGGFFGGANLIASAMPSAATAVRQDLLTNQSAFYGQGGFGGSLQQQTATVRAMQNALAKRGIATNSMDTTNALAMAQSLGMSGATNFNQVMQGAAVASTFAPGIGVTGAVQAMGTLNAPTTVNKLRTVGINIRGMDGSVKPLPQIADELWRFITQNGASGLSEKDVQIGLMPGGGLYSMLTDLVGQDPVTFSLLSNMLLAKARTGGKSLSSLSKSQLKDMGLTTATVNKMANQTAAQTNLLTGTASATAAGYGLSADLGAALNNFAMVAPELTRALGAFSGAYTGTMGLGNGAVGSFVKTITSLLAGKFLAGGGPADGNTPYIVGEQGPELFVPKTDGVVVPNYLLNTPHRDTGGPVKGMKTGEDLAKYLVAQGFSQAGAEGIVGNLVWESGLNTKALGDKGTSFGLAQWHGGRLDSLTAFAKSKGLDPNKAETQMQFLVRELNQKQYKGLTSDLKNPNISKAQAAAEFMRKFERPSDQSAEAALKRANAYKGMLGLSSKGAVTDSSSGASSVESSLSKTVSLSDKIQGLISAAAGAIGIGGGGTSAVTYNNGPLTINVNGASDPKKTAQEIQKILAANNYVTSAGAK
jgi:Phage tail lysozyme